MLVFALDSFSSRLTVASARNKQTQVIDYEINENDVLKIAPDFRRTLTSFATLEPSGTIIIDPHSKYLYLIISKEQAIRYGVGVGRQGFEWSGEAVIRRKAKWPRWTPPKKMVKRDKFAAKWVKGMPGSLSNPLGARALYLFRGEVDTLYRIHGTNQPESIGTATSSGCIRMINADVIDLYERVEIGAKILVVPKPIFETIDGVSRPTRLPPQNIFNPGVY